MTKETHYALNDLLNAVEELTSLVEELNPGANETILHIRYLLERAERSIAQAKAFEA